MRKRIARIKITKIARANAEHNTPGGFAASAPGPLGNCLTSRFRRIFPSEFLTGRGAAKRYGKFTVKTAKWRR
jgi:hypothetical protein